MCNLITRLNALLRWINMVVYVLILILMNTFLKYPSTSEFLVNYKLIEVASRRASIFKVFFWDDRITFSDSISKALDGGRPI